MSTGEDRSNDSQGPLDPKRSLDRLFAQYFDELREIAERQFDGERKGHTLQATALIHEAYVRLAGRPDLVGLPRPQFLAAVAIQIRRILVYHARRRKAAKRAGDRRVTISISDTPDQKGEREVDVLDLEEALLKLARLDERQAEIASLRAFGMTGDEVAEALGISPRTVDKEWQHAKAWLFSELSKGDAA